MSSRLKEFKKFCAIRKIQTAVPYFSYGRLCRLILQKLIAHSANMSWQIGLESLKFYAGKGKDKNRGGHTTKLIYCSGRCGVSPL